jgi:methionyl-tRNA synthetase
MSSPQRILVTAALPYANGEIHLGHLAGAYLPADIYVRYQRLRKRDVLFICGSDENGVAITVSAEREGVSPQVVVDRYHELNRSAFERFGMSFDNYSRTSLPLHHQVASEFFLELYGQGILREKREQQFFDESAGRFLPDRYVEGTCPVCSSPDARGDQCEQCGSYLNPLDLIEPRSKISGTVPTVRETTHLYFPLGSYQQRLEAYIAERDGRDHWKANVLQYCRGWFKDGLQDRAITRDLDWGVAVPVKGFEQKVIYVWFDAVLGYVSSTMEWARRRGEPEAWKPYWQNEDTKYVAFIGKDNVVFHCIVFPAMLMAWNDAREDRYVLPENVPANEFLNFEGQKFSKSKGWGIDVKDFLDRYSADSLRYYLATALPEYRDSDFTWRDFQARTNNELADILGNFVNRTLAFVGRTFQGKAPSRGELREEDRAMLELLARAPEEVGSRFEQYEFREGVLAAMNVARAANKYFNDSQPWATVRTNPDRCATTLSVCLQVVRGLAVVFSPVIPSAADRIWEMLGLEGKVSAASWESLSEDGFPAGHTTGTASILFTKIEDSVIENERKALGVTEPVKEASPGPALISIDEVRKADLRVAKVLACESVPKSKKLLKLNVDIGGHQRQILAGIAQHYAPEALIGKLIVVVANLQPAKLMGEESQGMLLAASDDSGSLVLIGPAGEIAPGARVQ